MYGTLYETMWRRTQQFYAWLVPAQVRGRLSAAHARVHTAWSKYVGRHDSKGAKEPPEQLQRGSLGGLSGAVPTTPRNVISALVRYSARPEDLTKFERKKTQLSGGSDAIV